MRLEIIAESNAVLAELRRLWDTGKLMTERQYVALRDAEVERLATRLASAAN